MLQKGLPLRLTTHGIRTMLGLIICLLTMVNLSIGQNNDQKSHVIESKLTGYIDWTAGIAVGRARSEAGGGGVLPASQRATAFAAAVHKARQHLRDIIVHLPLNAERTVKHVLQHSPEKRQSLEALIGEAQVVQTQYLPRHVIETTLQMPLSGSFTSLVWPTVPAMARLATESVETVHTGIIIDARGLMIRHALFPKIVDRDGQTIYGPARVDANAAVQRGYITYAKTLRDARAALRVGAHPLVIRAHRVAGQARVDLLIRGTDAARLQGSPTTRRLLQQCQVIIVG